MQASPQIPKALLYSVLDYNSEKIIFDTKIWISQLLSGPEFQLL